MNDVRTMLWKEWRELLAQGGDFGPKTTAVLMIAFLGIIAAMAVITGEFLVRSPILIVLALTPVLGILGLVAESFAGERERHTLETLLASRIRSESILAGKILVHVLYGYASTLLLSVVLVVAANARQFGGTWTLPSLPAVLLLAGLTPFALLFLSTLGALVSLRAPTVRQAQSRLVILFLAFFIALILLSKLGPQVAPDEAVRFIRSERGQLIIVGTWMMILAIADLGLLLLAYARFQRDRLIEIR